MPRKSEVVVVGILFLLVCFSNTAMAKNYTNNPIDKAFAQDLSEAMNTVEMNYVAEKYMDAWKAEMDNIAIVLKRRYTFAEDKARVDDYVAAYKNVADAAVYLE
jgi:ABC-type enterochelin transport system substrate-binding protein